MESQMQSVGQIQRVGRRQADEPDHSGGIHSTSTHRQNTGQAPNVQNVESVVRIHGTQHQPVHVVPEVPGRTGSTDTIAPSQSHHQATSYEAFGEGAPPVPWHRDNGQDSVENMREMDRNSADHAQHVPRDNTDQDSDRVGTKTQERATKTVFKTHVHGHRGRVDSGNSGAPKNDAAQPTFVDVVDAKDHERNEKTLREGVQLPQSQAWGDHVPTGPRREGNTNSRGGGSAGQTRERRDNNQIRGEPRDSSSSSWYAAGNSAYLVPSGTKMSYKASIEDAEDEKVLVEQLNRHTITRMRRPTRIATAEEIRTLPLHMEEKHMGPPICFEKVKLFMKDDVREGFEKTWNMHNAAPPKGFKPVFAKVPLQDWVCERTEKAGCCELVTPEMEKEYPTTDTILPRLVVEERDGDERLRLIGWTKADNDRLKKSYKPNVPLKHVSAYLSAVHQDAGGKRDALKSFYQAEIPVWARAKQRFKDESGRLWQMTRTSMGHCTMPEVMHTVTSTIAGHPDYCKDEHVLTINECDVYIDGIRAADDKKKLLSYFEKVDARAVSVNAQWKEKDSYIGKHYTFDGVDFDHDTHKVRISEKLRKKLNNTTTDKLTLAGLESLISRLIHGSAITNTFQPKYYFVMKYARRRIALKISS